MVTKALDIILKELESFFGAQKLKRQSETEAVFSNDKKAVRISYNADKKVFQLEIAELQEGTEIEFRTYSNYLFDEQCGENDAKGVAADFKETLESVFGIKQVAGVTSQVAIPKKNNANTTPNVDAFCGKFLSLFPQYKELYKADVAKYGAFMYENFFSKTAAEKLYELANDVTAKKNYAKMLTFLDQYFVDGDFTVQSLITYTIVGEACAKHEGLFAQIESELKDKAPHLYSSAKAMIEYRKIK